MRLPCLLRVLEPQGLLVVSVKVPAAFFFDRLSKPKGPGRKSLKLAFYTCTMIAGYIEQCRFIARRPVNSNGGAHAVPARAGTGRYGNSGGKRLTIGAGYSTS